MKEFVPDGQDLREAVKWVSAKLQENPDERIGRFINEATLKFNLTPKDAELLISFFTERAQYDK